MDNERKTSELSSYPLELIEEYGKKIEIYTLNGSNEKENIDRRITFLTILLNFSEKKEIYLTDVRQKYLNYSLVTFAALFTISLSLSTKLFSFYILVVLFILMIVFCLLDRRLHKFIHGWRKTEKILMKGINNVINNPVSDINIVRYALDGEKEAEARSLQPIIYYFLVVVSLLISFYYYLMI